jgi:hypothetical protein
VTATPEDTNAAITEMVHEAVGILLERGSELPLRCVILGHNGAVLSLRMDAREEGGLTTTFEADHVPDGFGLTTPINCMWVSGDGSEAIRVVLAADGTRRYVQ